MTARTHRCAAPGCVRHLTRGPFCEPCLNRLPLHLRVALNRARESVRHGAGIAWRHYQDAIDDARTHLRAQRATPASRGHP